MPRAEEIPLSFAQRRLWFMNRFETDNSAHNITLAVSIDGPLDVDQKRLLRSWGQVGPCGLDRHLPEARLVFA